MTEKNYNPEQKNAKAMKQQETAAQAKVEEKPIKAPDQSREATDKKSDEIQPDNKTKDSSAPAEAKPEKGEETKKEKKKKVPQKKIIKELAIVNAQSVPVSTKYAIAICKFILKKTPEKAIEDLEDVIAEKRAVPMKGEYAHKKSVKGYASGSGKYPKIAAGHFIKLVKSLIGNSNVNGIEEPVIVEAVANQASRPRARFGRWQRKRTHVKLVAKDKTETTKAKTKGRKVDDKKSDEVQDVNKTEKIASPKGERNEKDIKEKEGNALKGGKK